MERKWDNAEIKTKFQTYKLNRANGFHRNETPVKLNFFPSSMWMFFFYPLKINGNANDIKMWDLINEKPKWAIADSANGNTKQKQHNTRWVNSKLSFFYVSSQMRINVMDTFVYRLYPPIKRAFKREKKNEIKAWKWQLNCEIYFHYYLCYNGCVMRRGGREEAISLI